MITRLHVTKTSAGECWVSAVDGMAVAQVFRHGEACTVIPVHGRPVCGLSLPDADAFCLRLREVM